MNVSIKRYPSWSNFPHINSYWIFSINESIFLQNIFLNLFLKTRPKLVSIFMVAASGKELNPARTLDTSAIHLFPRAVHSRHLSEPTNHFHLITRTRLHLFPFSDSGLRGRPDKYVFIPFVPRTDIQIRHCRRDNEWGRREPQFGKVAGLRDPIFRAFGYFIVRRGNVVGSPAFFLGFESVSLGIS